MWYHNHMEESGTKTARKVYKWGHYFVVFFLSILPFERLLSCTISFAHRFFSHTTNAHTHTHTHPHPQDTHTHKDTHLDVLTDVSLDRLERECETAQLESHPACWLQKSRLYSSRYTKSREWHICVNVTLVFGRRSHNRKHKKVTQPTQPKAQKGHTTGVVWHPLYVSQYAVFVLSVVWPSLACEIK